MLFQLFFTILFFGGLGEISAIDPFAGPLSLNCFNERNVIGCNESLLEAYSKSDAENSNATVNKADTLMFLFTKCNKDNPEPLHKCGGKLPKNTCYKASKKTIIYVFGHVGCQCNTASMREMKDQCLYRGNYNVILIDWCWGNGPDYYDAVKNSRTVGKQIAFLIRNIVDQTGASLKKFHIVGVSLGAQVAAFAGQALRPKKIRRITGLDPALPGFHVDDPDQRLDQGDAEWVDIIHTGGGPCLPFFGDYRVIGHADFYVNGGSVQMSCLPHIVESLLKGDILYGLYSVVPSVCSHAHSLEYFKTSINPCDCLFIGVECKSYEDFESGMCKDCGEDGSKCAVMGMDWELFPRKKGNHTYYLDTSLFCPYCDNSGINLNGFVKLIEKCAAKRRCFNTESKI